MGGGPATIYPKADHSSQWWENDFSRGTFTSIQKILFHTTETPSWPGYKAGASAPTLTYHAKYRKWRQHNYLNRSARALVDPSWTPVRENRDDVIQIEIIAYSDERVADSVSGSVKVSELTDENYQDLADFVRFIRAEYGGPALRAPRFLAYPGSYGNSPVRMSSIEFDNFSGLLGHQHASGNSHGDPSNLDVAKIIRLAGGTTTPSVEEDEVVTPEDIDKIANAAASKVKYMEIGETGKSLQTYVLATAGHAGNAAAQAAAANTKADGLASALQVLAASLPVEIGAEFRKALEDGVLTVKWETEPPA